MASEKQNGEKSYRVLFCTKYVVDISNHEMKISESGLAPVRTGDLFNVNETL